MSDKIPDLNLFMMCEAADEGAFSDLPAGYHIRTCGPPELALWKAMPFDDPGTAEANRGVMARYFDDVYAPKGDLFYRTCLFVCGADDAPVATCFAWTAYGAITTIHWFKVLKPLEGRGIGRALLTAVMRGIAPGAYPVFLHTQPSSYRAIKLYTDFGFALLTDPAVGPRRNDLWECLPILRRYMPPRDFARLRTAEAPKFFLEAVSTSEVDEF